MSTFGNLQQVDLRKGWSHEAFDFTTWLVKPENLEMLSDEIGIEIAPIESEARTGRYSVDILAEEENTGRKVIIENQLEQTDHDHLGKLVTYGSGLDAEYIVWIVKAANDEHRQALEWLNDHTGNELNFFLLKLELWQIDDSKPAVKFNTVVKPNEWTKTLREQTQSKNLSETKLMQLDFWQQFKAFCKDKGSRLGTRKAFPQHWYEISIGSSEAHIALTVNTRDQELGCELYIQDDKEWFDELHEGKVEIEKEIGSELEWQRLDDKKASRIKLAKDFNFEDQDQWPDYFGWLKDKADKFKQVFGA
ncbi:DUF4268 domain-containing protein [Fodinibius sp. SL11]|uniref:DUF4268 domain-containing protein n=1 Tax=Fodinibius sp. SL11 TaxID=3425690 RepID=UPI003F885255